ncbi:YiiX/YebB-like N1pC/P60 family cysteine hydrolase [Streptococcus cristatus]|uniref:YiiX/YebB-like N1pC/P60 family cysteine hydrolase n=1 Tax=Streptococcus cristatus TaxID=45634 RepID=UPI000782D74B|nr:YiiX/YebB-like N1pC/P60 family cysteine hydrolase [Streptococcus cristatus]
MKIQDLQNGDLLFTVGQSEMAAAIRTATGSYSHVGIFFDGEIYHATLEKGVAHQPLSQLLEEGDIYHVFAYPEIDATSVFKEAKSHLGKSYNASFCAESEGFYCSEYIAQILPIFETIPMQFGDEENLISNFWQVYYEDLGLAVPIGQPGTNPSQLAQSAKLIYKGELHD